MTTETTNPPLNRSVDDDLPENSTTDLVNDNPAVDDNQDDDVVDDLDYLADDEVTDQMTDDVPENVQSRVSQFYQNVSESVYLPSFNFKEVLNGKFPLSYRLVGQIKWRWWLIMLTLAFLVFHVPYAAWALQRFINQFREICQCDFIHLIRKSDMVEGWTIFWNTNKYKELKYLLCRSACP